MRVGQSVEYYVRHREFGWTSYAGATLAEAKQYVADTVAMWAKMPTLTPEKAARADYANAFHLVRVRVERTTEILDHTGRKVRTSEARDG